MVLVRASCTLQNFSFTNPTDPEKPYDILVNNPKAIAFNSTVLLKKTTGGNLFRKQGYSFCMMFSVVL